MRGARRRPIRLTFVPPIRLTSRDPAKRGVPYGASDVSGPRRDADAAPHARRPLRADARRVAVVCRCRLR
ncbi:hypothetical protein CA831_38100, partial [Burkholderia multivorans]